MVCGGPGRGMSRSKPIGTLAGKRHGPPLCARRSAAHGMSAVNPDYFMASRFTEQAYMEGVDLLASVQKDPSRTAAEVHGMLGRRHPRLVAQFSDAYETTPVRADPDQPSTIFRGVACIRCEARLDDAADLRLGLCPDHLGL